MDKSASSLETIVEWFKAAKPSPTRFDLSVQVGCHLEEVLEMLEGFDFSSTNLDQESVQYYDHLVMAAITEMGALSAALKAGLVHARAKDREAILDATRDQCVTGVGIDYMMGANTVGAQAEVNRSNWSKFEDGAPVFGKFGKIAKGKDYTPPSLGRFVEQCFD